MALGGATPRAGILDTTSAAGAVRTVTSERSDHEPHSARCGTPDGGPVKNVGVRPGRRSDEAINTSQVSPGDPSSLPGSSGTPLRPLLAALYLVSLLSALNLTIVGASLATIVGDLGGLEHMAWAIVSYTLAATVALPVYGQLSDIRGRRRMFLTSLLIFVVGSVLCGLATSMLQLTAARVIQGIGGAGIGVLAQTILADVLPARQRAKYMSYLGSVFAIATVAGPLIGGVLTDTVGWRWIFFINAPLGAIAFAVAFASIPRLLPIRPTARFDVGGAGLLAIGLSTLVVALTLGGSTFDWGSMPMAALLGVAVALLTVFLIVEQRVELPIFPLVMFRDRLVVGAVSLSVVAGIGLLSVISYLPAFVQMRYAATATVAGVVPIAIVAGLLTSSNLTGIRISQTGRYRWYPIFGTALAAVALVILSLSIAQLPLWAMAGLFLVVGLGGGAFMQLTTVLVQNQAPQEYMGVATATVNLLRQVGMTLSTAIIGSVFASSLIRLLDPIDLPGEVTSSSLTPDVLWDASSALRKEVAGAYSESMEPIFIALAIVFAIGFTIALVLPTVRLKETLD